MIYSYIDAISSGYPLLSAYTTGDPFVYEDIISEEQLPPKAELDAYILVMTRNKMWLEIQDERTKRQNGGIFVQSSNKWFHSDQASRIQQLGLVMMGNNMPGNIMWKAMDGSFILMTPALALSIFNAAATLDMTAFAVAEQHRANMMALPTPETYNYSGFWPAIFGG